MLTTGATPVDFQCAPDRLGRAADLFNRRGEIGWFGFRGRFEERGFAVVDLSVLHPGALGGGGTAALNGGVIAAGFDAVSVLCGLGHYETETVVTLDLAVQFLTLALTDGDLVFRGWATRSARSLAFVQAALADRTQCFATAQAMVMPIFPREARRNP
jgi:acyl-coenzyme A thioesterase PaaI-like protein